MEPCRIEELYDLNETIAKDLFEGAAYPWEVLPKIKDFILELGKTLDPEEYTHRQYGEDVWIHKSAVVFDSAYIHGPAIICRDAEIRQCAFIRGSAIVGEHATVGNSTELKNVVLFNHVEVPHYNYVGDSVLGFYAHMGAGAITSNIKADRKNIGGSCRGGLQHRPESGYRGRQIYEHLSGEQCQRSDSGAQHIQGSRKDRQED